MITNWYTLEKLSFYLNEKLSGEMISQALTFNKNELILLNNNNQNPSVKINLFNPFQFILLDTFNKPRKTITIFPALQNEIIASVKIDNNDRNIWINFTSGASIIIIFRSNSGNVIYQKNDTSLLFKNNKKKLVEKTEYSNEKKSFDNILKNFRFNNFWKKNYTNFFNINSDEYQKFIEIMKKSNGNFIKNRFVLNENKNDDKFNSEFFYNNYKKFIITNFISNSFDEAYSNIKKQLLKQLERNKKSLKNLNDNDKLNKRIEKNRYFGDTLSIFQTNINKGKTEFEIPDEYQNSNFPKIIELQSNLNIHQIIKNYYDKAKKIEKKVAKNILDEKTFKKEFEKYLKIYEHFEKIDDNKTLKLWKENNKSILQNIQQTNTKQKDNIRVPYKEYITKSGWKIWVGKSARDNDEMTFHLANKNDLWLHTRHSTGSHVIIRKDGKKEIPMEIIKYAGTLSARNSDEKHSNMVSVIYTLKKYVVKRKGFTAGKVTFQFEKNISVNPLELK
ncbi:MAG: NFACT RNA binding domain-containing protein [Candidatus Marinimicrobia bacterium]|nr:NFACT RNA binding domain-containing protein [Candidatus Neomarinimicrobiota bacterium]